MKPIRYYNFDKVIPSERKQPMPRVTRKGQVTIPQEIRDKFSFHPGTEVQFQVRENTVILLKGQEGNSFLKWLGKGKRGKKEDIDGMVDRLRGRSDE